MYRLLISLIITLLGHLLTLPATAAVNPEVESAVNASLALGTGHGEIISSLTADPFNLSLEEATAMAIEAGGNSHAEAFAAAGIAAAADLPQAESVAAAARAASGLSPDVVDSALEEYVRLMDQPYIHHDGTIPTGGGAYEGPGSGIRPPVSPDF